VREAPPTPPPPPPHARAASDSVVAVCLGREWRGIQAEERNLSQHPCGTTMKMIRAASHRPVRRSQTSTAVDL
jgi:hypothetical protein